MHEKMITNSFGAEKGLNLVTYIDADGNPWDGPAEIVTELGCAAAIPKGTLVCLDAASVTATVPLRWRAWLGASDAANLIKGVTLKATTAAGQIVPVVTKGFCQALVTGQTPAVGNYGVVTAAQNVPTPGSAELAATVVPGAVVGIHLSIKDAVTNLAAFWFEHV